MQPGDRASSRILHRYLLDDEQVVVASRQHWARLLEPLLTTIAAFILLAWLSVPLEDWIGNFALMVWWVWLAVASRLLWRMLEWRNQWFVATDKRLLLTYGLVTHKVAMMPLRKVTDMNYQRSIMGRMLGYGQFIMESAGQDQAMRVINWLPSPDWAYRRICDTIFGPGVVDPDDTLGPLHITDDGLPEATPGARPTPEMTPSGDEEPERHQDNGSRDAYFAGEDFTGEGDEEDPGWSVSKEDASQFTSVGSADPDITGPIPRI